MASSLKRDRKKGVIRVIHAVQSVLEVQQTYNVVKDVWYWKFIFEFIQSFFCSPSVFWAVWCAQHSTCVWTHKHECSSSGHKVRLESNEQVQGSRHTWVRKTQKTGTQRPLLSEHSLPHTLHLAAATRMSSFIKKTPGGEWSVLLYPPHPGIPAYTMEVTHCFQGLSKHSVNGNCFTGNMTAI